MSFPVSHSFLTLWSQLQPVAGRRRLCAGLALFIPSALSGNSFQLQVHREREFYQGKRQRMEWHSFSHLHLLLLCLCPVMLPVSHSQERKQPIRIFHQELLRESSENGRRWLPIKNFSCQWWWNDQTTRSSITCKDQKHTVEIWRNFSENRTSKK